MYWYFTLPKSCPATPFSTLLIYVSNSITPSYHYHHHYYYYYHHYHYSFFLTGTGVQLNCISLQRYFSPTTMMNYNLISILQMQQQQQQQQQQQPLDPVMTQYFTSLDCFYLTRFFYIYWEYFITLPVH